MLFKNAFSGSYDAALYLQNVSASSAGTVAATQNVTLAANAISNIWLPSVAGLADGFAGGARITSTQDVIAVGRPHLGSEISAYNGDPAGGLNASLPMLFKNAYGVAISPPSTFRTRAAVRRMSISASTTAPVCSHASSPSIWRPEPQKASGCRP